MRSHVMPACMLALAVAGCTAQTPTESLAANTARTTDAASIPHTPVTFQGLKPDVRAEIDIPRLGLEMKASAAAVSVAPDRAFLAAGAGPLPHDDEVAGPGSYRLVTYTNRVAGVATRTVP